jgi:hypothetical protein
MSKQSENFLMSAKRGDTNTGRLTDRPTDRQSQSDFNLDCGQQWHRYDATKLTPTAEGNTIELKDPIPSILLVARRETKPLLLPLFTTFRLKMVTAPFAETLGLQRITRLRPEI